MTASVTLPNKKVYETPKLLRYGSLTEMTLAIGMRGASDGATMGTNRKTV